jgi:hypothetical protein
MLYVFDCPGQALPEPVIAEGNPGTGHWEYPLTKTLTNNKVILTLSINLVNDVISINIFFVAHTVFRLIRLQYLKKFCMSFKIFLKSLAKTLQKP